MGTIAKRTYKSGKVSYQAQVLIKRDGQIVHRESRSFDRKQAATVWMVKREDDLQKGDGLKRAQQIEPTLGEIIERYVDESLKEIGRTKAQVLRTIKNDFDIADMKASLITSVEIVGLAKSLKTSRQPQTVANYLSHLGAIFAISRAAWGYPLDPQAMKDALIVCKRLGLITKSKERDRRPTLTELDTLLVHFTDRQIRVPGMVPMTKIVPFAIFSTRRQEEITTIRWGDLDEGHSRILVRDMKNPGEKIGNNIWCDLPPEALAIIKSMPRVSDRIFPFTTDAMSANFTRACQLLGVEDLHFHDLRHDGISRLFELGNSIPRVASVSGHRSWQSLKRYTHIRQTGDKYKGWKWFSAAIGDDLPSTTEPQGIEPSLPVPAKKRPTRTRVSIHQLSRSAAQRSNMPEKRPASPICCAPKVAR